MRIFYSTDSDPMILGSISNLNAIHLELAEFLGKEWERIRIKAITAGSPEPYSELLPYIEFIKSQGNVLVEFGEDRGLLISGSLENLAKYIEAFEFGEDEDGNHHHPEFSLVNERYFEMGSLWPFVEADNGYVAEH
jgi:hypothetical protein